MSQGEVMDGCLTAEDLAKLVEMEAAATERPWKRIAQGGSSTVTTQERPGRNDTRIPGYAYRDDEHCLAYPFIEDDGRTRLDFVCFSHADAALIAAARNAMPALLASAAAVQVMREALEKADHALTYAIIQMERDFLVGKLEATQKTVRAALSGIEGEDEQARPSGSAPISTDTKGTTK